MSVAFPTDKDAIIDELEDAHDLELTEQESVALRKMTTGQLLMLAVLFARARRKLHSRA
jgi:hypothetical protein